MFTLLFITIIVLAIMGSKKKYHNSNTIIDARRNFPDFVIQSTEMSTFNKVWYYGLDKNEILNYISYNKGWVIIRMESGKEISGWLAELQSSFYKYNGNISYEVQSKCGKVRFYRISNISNNQWDVINSLLCLSGVTRGEEIFGSAYKRIGYVNTALRALRFFQ